MYSLYSPASKRHCKTASSFRELASIFFETIYNDPSKIVNHCKNLKDYQDQCARFKLAENPIVLGVMRVLENCSFSYDILPVTDDLSIFDLNPNQLSQVESLNIGIFHPWKLAINKLAILGEHFVGKLCADNQICLEKISEYEHGASIDFRLAGADFDCKTRMSIGHKMDGSLPRDRWDGVENIILVSISANNYNSSNVRCRLLGVFVPELIRRHGLERILLGFSYFSPPFFADAMSYFKGESFYE